MKNKKLVFLFIGVVIMILLSAAFLVFMFSNPKDCVIVAVSFWPAWITGFGAMIAYYFKQNVKQKEIISTHYNPALDDKSKGGSMCG